MSEKELKNGIISEESLEEIAGGLKINKESLKKYVKKAGIAIVSAGALAAAGYYGGKAAGFWGNRGNNSIDTTEPEALLYLNTMADAYESANEVGFQPTAVRGNFFPRNKRS